MRTNFFNLMLVVAFFILPNQSFSQEDKKVVPDGTDGSVLLVPEVDSVTGKIKIEPANEVISSISTFKVGLGFIADFAAYSQDKMFKQQMDSAGIEMKSMYKTRDLRILGSGKLLTKRNITWKFAFMYDGDKDEWLVRETGVTIGVPELAGSLFIGRTKEGYSMEKVMNGYCTWADERQMALDVIPIFADGIKYFGYLQKSRIFWNVGLYNDYLSKGLGFSTYEWQYDARIGCLPIYDKEKDKLLHVAVNYRHGKTLDGKIALKSRPESNPAPQIINTGSFASDYSDHYGAEIYYSTGRLFLGSEVMVHQFNSSATDDHQFIGGDAFVTWFFTNSSHPYNTTGSVYGFVPVKKSVFKGGWGEWEGVLRFSSFDLNDGSVKGGKFWRITPMLNWYMSKALRMEFVYGYGVLDRYNLTGAVQIFQTRLQLFI
jgi:phosphate-selective porin OprO and OprP